LGVLPVDPVADAAQQREFAQVLRYVSQSGACAASWFLGLRSIP
jgi:hypothetical protein